MERTLQKKQEAISDLKDWLNGPNLIQVYHERPMTEIEANLLEPKLKKSTRLNFDDMSVLHLNQFVYNSLVNDKQDAAAMLKYSTTAFEALHLALLFAKAYPGNPPKGNFHSLAKYLANTIIMGWRKESEFAIDGLLAGLETNFLKKGHEFKPAAWFIIELAAKASGKSFDRSLYNYPKETVYADALYAWNTTDVGSVDAMISKLADYHLEQADFGDENSSIFLQFSYSNEFVYAFEILTWLSLRKRHGLENPSLFSHSLMQLPINQLPVGLSVLQHTRHYELVVEKLKAEFPGLE